MYINGTEDHVKSVRNFEALNCSIPRAEDPYFEKIVPTIVIVGLVSGLFAILVLFRRDMRDMSYAQYLLGNTIANMTYLCCIGVVCLQSAGYRMLNNNLVFQVFVWLTHSSSSFATWCVVISGADNCVRLCWPLLVPDYCSTTRSKEVLNALLFTVGISYSVAQWTSPAIEFTNTNFEEWIGLFSKPRDLLTIVDILMDGVFPIVVSLPSAFRLGVQLGRKPERNEHHQLRSTILMLFAVQLIFLLLFLPGFVGSIYLVISALAPKLKTTPTYLLVSRVCQLLYYASCSVNFFIFLSAWRLFRCKLWGTFRQDLCGRGKNECIVIELETNAMNLLRCGRPRSVALSSSLSCDNNERYRVRK